MQNIKKLWAFIFLLFSSHGWTESLEYSAILCKQQGYTCVKIKRQNSWSQLFPNPSERDLVKRINRLNDFLKPGMTLAVPIKLHESNLFSVSPLPLTMPSQQEKFIFVDQKLQAFGAYNEFGQLLLWGPVSSGKILCESNLEGCLTPTGTFRISHKKGRQCFSNSLPKRVNGAHGGGYMPYCMFFQKGYALHGSESLPGYRSSHGCIRLFIEDAQWLHDNFVQTTDAHRKGTKLIITPID